MPTTNYNSTDKEVPTFPAKTDWTIKGIMYNPQQSKIDVAAYKFKAYIRGGRGSRVLKTYSHSTGGLTVSTSGALILAVDASDIPPTPRGDIEIVGYSGGSYAGDPTDRWHLSFTAE